MNYALFIILLFALQFLYWYVAHLSSREVNETADYYLAGKNVRLFPLAMTFLATQVGGGIVLGAADEAYRYGWPVLLYPFGQAVGLMILGAGMGRKLASFNVSTVAEIFEVVYKSKMLRKIASALSVISLFMILVAQIIASQKFVVSLGMVSTPIFILFWAVVIIYTAQGGLKAVISTDIVQAVFFSIVFLICFGFVLYTNPGEIPSQLLSFDNFSNVSSKLTGWILMPLLFIIIEQDMGQRCFAGGSPQIVSRAAMIAGLVTLLVCIVPVYFGSLANALAVDIPQGGSVLMATIKAVTTPEITAIVGCAVLAAVISTATSLINAISSNLSSDFNLATSMRGVRFMTTSISIFAIVFAFYFDNIVDLLIQSYELSVSCLFVPLIFALFNRKGSASQALASILFGAAGFVLFLFLPIPFPKEIASLALSLSGYLLSGLIKEKC